MIPLKNRKMTALVAILMPLVFSFAIALDIYIPIVPDMVKIFHTTPGLVQLTLSLFMLTMGVGQLFFGPLSDKIGRRKTIFFSISCYILGSFVCALSPSIYILILGRVIQAAGGCGTIVSANAIVRDIYHGDQAGKIYSHLNGAIAFSPLLAPLIGGYLAVWFSWRAPFIFLTLFGLVGFYLLATKIDETLAPEKRTPIDRHLFRHYFAILGNPDFRHYVLCIISGIACFFTFFCISPYLLIKRFGISIDHFGYYFGSFGILFFIGSMISGHCCIRFGIFKTALIGVVMIALSGVLFLLWDAVFGVTLAGFIVPMMVISIGGSLSMGAGAAGALAPFGDKAGTASAMMGCLQFLAAALIGTLAAARHVTSSLPLAYTALILGILACLSCWCYHRRV